MASSPLSGVLSPAQIAVVQQARALIARPTPPAAAQKTEPIEAQRPASPSLVRGRGAIINITV